MAPSIIPTIPLMVPDVTAAIPPPKIAHPVDVTAGFLRNSGISSSFPISTLSFGSASAFLSLIFS